eukprot:3643577-Pleurochrysis_carterae.AAC.1
MAHRETRAAAPPAPLAASQGMHRVHPPDRIGGPTARVPPQQKPRTRARAPRWSGGRSPRALRPRRPSPISQERGARQPTQAWAYPPGGRG